MEMPSISSSITSASGAAFRFHCFVGDLFVDAGVGAGAPTTAGTNNDSGLVVACADLRAARRQVNNCCGDKA